MFSERDRQDDCVGLECILQRLGDDRGSNRPSLRCQRLGGPATRNGHVDVFTGEGVGEGLTYLSESYNCIAHHVSPILLILIPSLGRRGTSIPFVATFRKRLAVKSADVRWPSCRRRRTTPPRSRSSSRLKQETARPSRLPQIDPSFPAGSGIRNTASLPW